MTGHFCSSGYLGGRGPSRDPTLSAERGDTPQVRYQVLKLNGICPLPESPQTPHHSTKQSLLPVSSVCFVPDKPAFTPHWT